MEKIEKKFWNYIDNKISNRPIDYHSFSLDEIEVIKNVAKDNKIFFLIEEDFLESTFERKLMHDVNILRYNNTLYITNQVLKEFTTNNIDYVIYKGAINNIILFNSFVREFSDIDLMIKKTDFEKAWKILYDKGYVERDDEGNESAIYDFKYSNGGAQFVKNNNSHILSIDLHTNIPFLDGFSIDVLYSRIELIYNNMTFKIPNRTYYFLIMLINLYDNFCTRYGILFNYCFNDIYESILFYKKFAAEINLNQIIEIFNDFKRVDIINYVLYVLNLFSPNLFENNILLKCCPNKDNSLQEVHFDSDYLSLDIKSCLFSKTKRMISYNNNVRFKKPNYYFPTILKPPLVIESLENVKDCFNTIYYYEMQSTGNNKFNEKVFFNVAQNEKYFILLFKDLSKLTDHIFELCLFNNDYDSEKLNDIFYFNIVDDIVENKQSPVMIKKNNNQIAFLIPFTILKIYEDRYVLLSFLFRKRYSSSLSRVILGKGWYTSPVKYYLK